MAHTRKSNTSEVDTPIGMGRVGHPAAQRVDIPLTLLWFGLAGGPAAWTIQTLVNLTVASHGCFPQLFPLVQPGTPGLRAVVLVTSAVALAVTVAATIVSAKAWWRTREEHQENSGAGRDHGSHTSLLETGEGRTRFMAMAGFLTSLLFLLVIAAHGATVFLVSPCSALP